MLDQLLQIVQQNAQADVIENDAVPNDQNDAVMAEASSTIMGSLQQLIAQGKTDQVASLMKGNDDSNTNEAMGFISGNFIDNITQKFGIDKSAAMNMAASMLPQILGSFFNKAKDPNDNSFNLQDIIGTLTGGSGGNPNQGGANKSIIDSLGSQFGLDKDNDGDVDLGDIMGMFK